MSTKYRAPEFSHGANSARAAKVVQRRSSGAAGPHADRRTRRVRQRGAAVRTAVSRSQGGC